MRSLPLSGRLKVGEGETPVEPVRRRRWAYLPFRRHAAPPLGRISSEGRARKKKPRLEIQARLRIGEIYR
jgi:hypothetical protein